MLKWDVGVKGKENKMDLQLVDFVSRFMSSYSNNLQHFPACFAAPVSDLCNSALIQPVAYESFSISLNIK